MAKSKLNVNDLSTWPIFLTLIVSISIIGLLFWISKLIFTDEVVQNIQTKNTQVAKQEKTYAKNQEIIAILPHIRKEVAELELIRNNAKKFLPTEVSMPSLIDNVYLAARDNGIVFSKFTPENDIDKEFYTIKPISLKTDVGYLSMSAFIEQVTTLKRIMNIESVSFRSKRSGRNQEFEEGQNTPLTMTAQLRTYIFKDTNDSDSTKGKRK